MFLNGRWKKYFPPPVSLDSETRGRRLVQTLGGSRIGLPLETIVEKIPLPPNFNVELHWPFHSHAHFQLRWHNIELGGRGGTISSTYGLLPNLFLLNTDGLLPNLFLLNATNYLRPKRKTRQQPSVRKVIRGKSEVKFSPRRIGFWCLVA